MTGTIYTYPELSRWWRSTGAAALFLFGLTCVASKCACTPATSAAAAESAYTAELLRCVDVARTLDESRACRRDVDARWGVDGGAR